LQELFFNFHSKRCIPAEEAQKYKFKSPIPEPVINKRPSPYSSRIGYGCNVLINPNFTIDWPFCKEDYYSASNASKCQWFEQINRKLREKVKQTWIVDMQRLGVNIPFFLWFLTFTSQKGLNNVPKDKCSNQSCKSFGILLMVQVWSPSILLRANP